MASKKQAAAKSAQVPAKKARAKAKTAQAQPAAPADAPEQGCCDVLSKPLTDASLQKLIDCGLTLGFHFNIVEAAGLQGQSRQDLINLLNVLKGHASLVTIACQPSACNPNPTQQLSVAALQTALTPTRANAAGKKRKPASKKKPKA